MKAPVRKLKALQGQHDSLKQQRAALAEQHEAVKQQHATGERTSRLLASCINAACAKDNP